MSNLYILCGIPGCGKSTWAENFVPNAQVVSSDTIRAELTGDEDDQTRNKEVFEIFHKTIQDYLDFDRDVVADATHLYRSSRYETKRDARPTDKVHIVLFTNTAQAVMRNMTRERVVPPNIMYKMLSNYERTLIEIQGEPYDTVTNVCDFRLGS